MENSVYKCSVIFTILLLNSLLPTSSSIRSYCAKEYDCSSPAEVNLNNAKHLLCYHDKCRPAKRCGSTTILCNSVKFRNIMLSVHNRLRSEEAIGRSSNPANMIANMKALSYDLDREFLAYCTSSLCTGNPNDEVGCKQSKNGKGPIVEHVLNAVSSPSLDVNYDDEQLLESMIKILFETRHPLRASLKYVGCSRRLTQIRGKLPTIRYNLVLSCAYGEDYQFEQITGSAPCTRCTPPDRCNNGYKYKGLCGRVMPIQKNHTNLPEDYILSEEEQTEYQKNGRMCGKARIGRDASDGILTPDFPFPPDDGTVEEHIVKTHKQILETVNKLVEQLSEKLDIRNKTKPSGNDDYKPDYPDGGGKDNFGDYGLKNMSYLYSTDGAVGILFSGGWHAVTLTLFAIILTLSYYELVK